MGPDLSTTRWIQSRAAGLHTRCRPDRFASPTFAAVRIAPPSLAATLCGQLSTPILGDTFKFKGQLQGEGCCRAGLQRRLESRQDRLFP